MFDETLIQQNNTSQKTRNTQPRTSQQEHPDAQSYRCSDDPDVPAVVHYGGSRSRLKTRNHQSHVDRRARERDALHEAQADPENFDPGARGLRVVEPHRGNKRRR